MCASGNKCVSDSTRDYLKSKLQWLALMLMFACGAAPAASMQAHSVEDLDYGRALFDFFQDNELQAITQLMIAQARPRPQSQLDEANLLLADLFYHYGLYEESRQLFAQLLDARVSDSVQNRIWFNLARLRFDQGYYTHSRELLSLINDRLPAEIEAERKYLLTNLMLNERQYDEAADLSNRMNPNSIWKTYARYNLGVSLIEDERYEQGRYLLDEIGNMETRSSEAMALRDRANLSLGLKQLRLDMPEEARDSLSRVRLEGPLSHEALLAAGWAWYRMGDFDKAQLPWRVLLRRNAIDAPTQEAILAIPLNFAESGQDRLALQYFEIAADQFGAQLQLLDRARESIDNDGLIAALWESTILKYRAPLRDLPPSSDVTPHLQLLLASTEFQRETKRYQDLLDIRYSLGYWDNSFPALGLMLEERRQRFEDKLPLLQRSTSFERLNQLTRQRDVFAERLRDIESREDYAGLATVEEQEQLERLQRVADGIVKIGDRRNTATQQEMSRTLSGLLHYQLATDYPVRLWRARKQLIGVNRALTEAENRSNGLRLIGERTDVEFGLYQDRISGQLQRIRGLRSRVDRLLEQQEQRINQLATQEIIRQQSHIAQLRLNARYELARLYDKLAESQ